jgi:hypothetical protein
VTIEDLGLGVTLTGMGTLEDAGLVMNATISVADANLLLGGTNSQDFIASIGTVLILYVLSSDQGPVQGRVTASPGEPTHIRLCGGAQGTWADLKTGLTADVSRSIFNTASHGVRGHELRQHRELRVGVDAFLSAPAACRKRVRRVSGRFRPDSAPGNIQVHRGLVANDPRIMPGRDMPEVSGTELFLASAVGDPHPSRDHFIQTDPWHRQRGRSERAVERARSRSGCPSR